MEKRLSLSRGPFYNPSIDQIEGIVSLLLADITQLLKGHKGESEFPNKDNLLASYEWADRLQFTDTVHALSKLQLEINHQLAHSGGLDLLERGNYTVVKYRGGTIFIT